MAEKRGDDKKSEDIEDPSDSAKRRRTASVTVETPSASWMTSPSPPRFTSFEELMSAAKGLDNMALAHEISINDSFRLEKSTAADNSLEKVVSDVMHKAFWEVLKEQLASDPPNYDYAIKLLEEVKKELKGLLLLPQHNRIAQEIEDRLDIQLARQKASTGSLEFPEYANYIISVMEGLCAPIRDDNIRQLKQIDDVILVFKGIFEALDLMKLDMANFTISTFRPVIAARSVEYERIQFQKYLDLTPDGLHSAEAWLKVAYQRELVRNPIDLTADKVLSAALCDILESNWSDAQFPETLLIDKKRLDELSGRFFHLILTASAVLITSSCGGADVATSDPFKKDLKEKLLVLLEGTTQDNIIEQIEMICDRITHELQLAVEKFGWTNITEAKMTELKAQVGQLVYPSQPVRNLVRLRIRQFHTDLLTSAHQPTQVQMPPGLSVVAEEIKEATGRFYRIVSHNRSVFKDIYKRIVEGLMVTTQQESHSAV